jgi:hypothetical protein
MISFLKGVSLCAMLVFLLLPVCGVAGPRSETPVQQGRVVVFVYGPFVRSISFSDLKLFCDTGESRGDVGNFLLLSGYDPGAVKDFLTSEIEVDFVEADMILNSSLGVAFLEKVGAVVHPRHTSQYAVEMLRSAVMMSLFDDNKVSLLEFIENLPVDALVDVELALPLLSEISASSGE